MEDCWEGDHKKEKQHPGHERTCAGGIPLMNAKVSCGWRLVCTRDRFSFRFICGNEEEQGEV